MTCLNTRSDAVYSRRSVLSVLLAASVLGISACSDSDNSSTDLSTVNPNDAVNPNENIPPPTDDTIADNLLRRTDYQTLLRLIEESDLVDALRADNNGMGWTLFAPSDTAFENEAFESLTAEQSDFLVRNHLHSGQLSTSELMAGELQMTAGSVEIVRNPDGGITVGGATIVAGDRVMNNGVIHFVGSVLEPL